MFDDDYDDETMVNILMDDQFRANEPSAIANRLILELESRLSKHESELEDRVCQNDYGISKRGYKLAYSVCGFLCTQIIDLHKIRGIIEHPLGSYVLNHEYQIFDFVDNILKNNIKYIGQDTHRYMITIIRGYEEGLQKQGKKDVAFIFREAIREFFGKIDGGYSKTFYNSLSNTGADGCFVATAIYGSYNCPEVWTLRRFRDNFLAERKLGRKFIRLYYRYSPKLVNGVIHHKKLKAVINVMLDSLVSKLYQMGYDNTPYKDR